MKYSQRFLVVKELLRSNGGEYVEWPQFVRFGTSILSILILSVSLFFGWVLFATIDDLNYPGMLLSAVIIALTLGLFLKYVKVSGFRYLGLSRKIRPVEILGGRAGIKISYSRELIFLSLVLGVISTYGFLAGYFFYSDASYSLLPLGRDGTYGANYMILCGVVCVVALVGLVYLRTPVEIIICPQGIRRLIHGRYFMKTKVRDTFVRWGDLDEVIPSDEILNLGIEFHNPIIKLKSTNVIAQSERLKIDGMNEVVIRVHALVVEPNALVNLVRFLRDNPEHRSILVDPDARELLRPLPLFERFRQAKELKRLESEEKKARNAGRKAGG